MVMNSIDTMNAQSPALIQIELQVSRWLQAPVEFSLSHLLGKVVVIHTFQMLCPGCVLQSIPQAARLAALEIPELAIVGLHTVFEHHEVMSEAALAVFLAEYRIGYPVGIDAHVGEDPIPQTMRSLALRGTPTTLLVDRQGRLREQRFGMIDDLVLGCLIGSLLAESVPVSLNLELATPRALIPAGCSTDGCGQTEPTR
jgi:hypothetical protein